jgi:hypothetical protein
MAGATVLKLGGKYGASNVVALPKKIPPMDKWELGKIQQSPLNFKGHWIGSHLDSYMMDKIQFCSSQWLGLLWLGFLQQKVWYAS